MAVRKTTRRTTKKEVTPSQTKVSRRREVSRVHKSLRQPKKGNSRTLLDYFRFGESYTSLVLGIIVVIIASILLVSLFKTRSNSAHLIDTQKGTTSISTIAEQLQKITPTSVPTVTTVPTTSQVTPTPTKVPTPTPTKVAAVTPTPTPKTILELRQKTYTVKPGDDLWHIAESQYHDGYQWVAIARANNLSNPGVINVGNKLVIPSITPTPTQVPQQTVLSGPKINGMSYIIKLGDNLWDISMRAYGNGYKWVDLAKANNISNPNIINVGNKLIIPR